MGQRGAGTAPVAGNFHFSNLVEIRLAPERWGYGCQGKYDED
jgi:hypothetical protein